MPPFSGEKRIIILVEFDEPGQKDEMLNIYIQAVYSPIKYYTV